MNKTLLLVLVVLVAFAAPRIYHLVWILGYHKSHYNHHPGPCRILKGIDYGSEDMELLPDDTVLISSGLRLFGTFEKDVPEDFKGRVYRFDLKAPEGEPVEVPIRGIPSPADFNPHGMSSWIDDEVIIYVITHYSDHSVVMSFIYADDVLVYRSTHGEGNDAFLLPNDLIAVAKDKFYYTNFQYSRSLPIEILLGLPWASVGFYDGTKGRIVVPNLKSGNGINVSPDGKYVYVSEIGFGGIRVYTREDDDSLVQIEAIPLSTNVDNIIVDKETGDLWLGCHYVMAKMADYASDPLRNTCPSQILRLGVTSGHVTDVTEVLMDDGKLFSGSSVAIYRFNKILVGSVHTKAMICDAKHV